MELSANSWGESGLPMDFARELWRIRSPLLCPLSYGRIGPVFSHEGYCSAGVERIASRDPG